MYPFPPPPPLNAQAVVLHVLMLGLGLLAVAGLWMTRKRVARGIDVIPWCLAIAVGVVFGVQSLVVRHEYVPFYLGYMTFVIVVAGIGLFRTFRSLRGQGKHPTAWMSILALLLLGLLVMLLLPGVPSAREAAKRSQCLYQLRNISNAMHNWYDEHGRFPDAAAPEEEGGSPVSWRVQLLDLLEYADVSRAYDRQQAWDSETNASLAMQSDAMYSCPSNLHERDKHGRFYTAYSVMTGLDTAFPEGRGLAMADIASTSATILIGEACGLNIVWTEPRDVDVTKEKVGINLPGEKPRTSTGVLSSYHEGGANVMLADGSGRFLSESIDPEVLQMLLSADQVPGDF